MADAVEEKERADGEGKKVVLRVKRKYTEDPVDALLVAHVVKRQHLSSTKGDGKDNEHSTVERLFRLVGSVPEEDHKGGNDILQKLKDKPISHQQIGRTQEKSLQRIQDKMRKDKKTLSQEARFRIVSKRRPFSDKKSSGADAGACKQLSDEDSLRRQDQPPDDKEIDEEVQRLFNVYDVVRDLENKADDRKKKRRQKVKEELQDANAILCNSTKMIREKLSVTEAAKTKEDLLEAGYVYDLYTTYDSYGALGEMVEIMPIAQQDFVFETMEQEFAEIYDDEDDSNDEENWRNDYPDHDPWESDPEEEKRYFGDYGFNYDDACRGFGADLSSDEEPDRIYFGQRYNQPNRVEEEHFDELSD